MSEMVERVARAICKSQGENPDDPFESLDTYPPYIVLQWHRFSRQARAAIAAMREPTQAMIEACGADDYYDSFDLRYGNWRTMIDAALEEK